MRGRRRGWRLLRPSELSAQQGGHRLRGAPRIDGHAVRQCERGTHRIGQRLRVGLHHHGDAEPGGLDRFHQFRYRQLGRHPHQ
jgi:hypothetical protein